jgi:hypothetical protein
MLETSRLSLNLSFLQECDRYRLYVSVLFVYRWLQPDSYLDPSHCELMYSKEDLRCGWPALITVLTKDQYGQLVHVPNLKVCNCSQALIISYFYLYEIV